MILWLVWFVVRKYCGFRLGGLACFHFYKTNNLRDAYSKITVCPGSKLSLVSNLAVFLDFKGSKGNEKN